MSRFARCLCVLAALGTLSSGCKQSDPGDERKAGEAPKRAPKIATMYVESRGEALNAGGKKVEKSDEAGSAKGGFSPKDLLMPGMFVLVSGATALGGPLLIKALDTKDRPGGPVTVAGGGADGTFVPVETSGSSTPDGTASPSTGSSGPESSGSPSGSPAAEAPGSAAPPDPTTIIAVARSGSFTASPTLASGHGVVSTASTILMSMGYASGFSGPSYISGKLTSSGLEPFRMTETHVYSWALMVDKTATSRSGKVDVFATFTGLKAGDLVTLMLTVTTEATFTCDRTPLIYTAPLKGLTDEWLFHRSADLGPTPLNVYSLTFRLPAPDTPIRIGYLTVEGETDITGESVAEVTVH